MCFTHLSNPISLQTRYEGSVDETAPIGAAVMSFSAFDADEEAKDNVFTYQLAEESEYFYVTTDKDSKQSSVGVLRVKQVSFVFFCFKGDTRLKMRFFGFYGKFEK